MAPAGHVRVHKLQPPQPRFARTPNKLNRETSDRTAPQGQRKRRKRTKQEHGKEGKARGETHRSRCPGPRKQWFERRKVRKGHGVQDPHHQVPKHHVAQPVQHAPDSVQKARGPPAPVQHLLQGSEGANIPTEHPSKEQAPQHRKKERQNTAGVSLEKHILNRGRRAKKPTQGEPQDGHPDRQENLA